MATVDFTPVQELIGRDICFRDFAFEKQFQEFAGSFNDENFKTECYQDRFKFGRVAGCAGELDSSGKMVFSILVDKDFFNLQDLEVLFVS